MSIDFNQVRYLLKSLLQSDAGVTSIVSDRVFPQHMWSLDSESPTCPFVVFSSIGGEILYSKILGTLQFEVYCYSKVNASEAFAVSQKVYDALQESRLSVDGITNRGIIRQLDSGYEAFNPEMMAYYVRSTYEAKVVS